MIKMPKKKNNHKKPGAGIGEEIRIAVKLSLRKFLKTDENKEFEFPSSLTSDERAYIHELAKELGLRSKSRGKGASRYLTVYKREGSSIVQADAVFQLVRSSRQHVYTLLHKFPLTNKERQELLPLTERDRMLNPEVKDMNKSMGRLNNGIPQLPAATVNQELLPFRQSLPIWPMKDEIINSINNNQVPQFILEHCQSTSKACRIICTEPRRISAVSVSERVAIERDDKVGQSVGYQIRLESRVSPKTVLTFCTDGVLLRTLMGGDSTLATVTHILVDEIHERNRFSDFLLIALRDSLAKFRSLRLILMSATIETQIFTKYFNNCPVITVPGRQFEVQEYFLEDILKRTKYMSKVMRKLKEETESKKEQRLKLEKWTKCVTESSQEERLQRTERRAIPAPILGQQNEQPVPERTELEAWLVDEMDRCISEAWLSGSEDAFTQLLHLILSENVSVDYQHSQTSVTPLMVAAGRGCLNTAEQLLNLGANLNVRASNEWTALDWARHMKQNDVVELIEAYMNTDLSNCPDLLLANEDTELGEEEKELLDIYHHSFNDENIDMDLLMTLLIDLHSTQDKGDQKRVFRPAPPGVRKIILSTNIAETCVTIDDVVYVIDAGKVKEKSYDAMSGVCMLRPVWISQACSKQRKGRAGRTQPGICYHMFSSIRYKAMQKYHTPEILRMPLQELCLHTKLLAPANTPIADFLARAIEPPSFVVTRNAVQLLKLELYLTCVVPQTIDALDSWEDLTELGHHLLDLPIEPRLGKMLLYSVVLKCLDPVLTIVCCLAYRDPFVLPAQPSQKRASCLSRKKFAAGTYSDHMALLRAFQTWQHARGNGWEKVFCDKHFISAATMEMVVAMRTQLLGQLRASGFVRARGGLDIRDLNTNSENWAVVKAALCAGMYPNLIRVDRENMQLRTQKEFRVTFHPSSTLRECPKSPRTSVAASHSATVEALPSDWLVYEEMSRSGRFCHVRCCTLVTPITVAIFAGPARMPLDAVSEAESKLTIVDAEAAHLALQLRQKWHSLFLRRMRAPTKPWSQVDEAVVKTIINVLAAEEQAMGLQQPSGIGQRPRPMSIDYYPAGSRRATDEGEIHDENVFLGNIENRSGYRQQRKFEYSPKMAADHAGSLKTIETSLSRGAWAFTPNTERKMTRVFKEGKRVILVFSVQGSGHFQGFARLSGDKPDLKTDPADQCLELSGPNLSPPLPEIEPSVGEALCSLWDKVPPFVPKSTLFGSLKSSQDMPETTTASKNMSYHGRPIRGYSYVGYGAGYQHYNMNYGPRSQHPK
ncbi:putative ATP-dependent RNA helicase YTHDC2 [Blattella germanica]|nr:putative ATP-dependent RNA helicase YTHDC2 [Blattella germanica]